MADPRAQVLADQKLIQQQAKTLYTHLQGNNAQRFLSTYVPAALGVTCILAIGTGCYKMYNGIGKADM